MAVLSLNEAAELAGTSRSSLFRAVKAGRVSAHRNDAGELRFDPSEVLRAYGDGNAPRRGKRVVVERSDHPERNDPERVERGDPTRPCSCAALEAEIKLLRELVARLDRDKADLQVERDRWANQIDRLTLALAPPPVRQSWVWPWRR
jgi:hypothetical protein